MQMIGDHITLFTCGRIPSKQQVRVGMPMTTLLADLISVIAGTLLNTCGDYGLGLGCWLPLLG